MEFVPIHPHCTMTVLKIVTVTHDSDSQNIFELKQENCHQTVAFQSRSIKPFIHLKLLFNQTTKIK